MNNCIEASEKCPAETAAVTSSVRTTGLRGGIGFIIHNFRKAVPCFSKVNAFFRKQKAGIGTCCQIRENDCQPEKQKCILQYQRELQYQRLVSRLRNYILRDRDFSEPVMNRDELITALTTNRTTLSLAVKAVTDKTLMQYINYLRLEEAKLMLEKHSEFTIEAIAEQCGFNARTFYRLFNEFYQISPAKYRKLPSTPERLERLPDNTFRKNITLSNRLKAMH
jgi:AraC-like DNA-binding protein